MKPFQGLVIELLLKLESNADFYSYLLSWDLQVNLHSLYEQIQIL